jgi:FtsP/CotA-like multicopper oxidase with cupredoxin domain
MISRRRLLRVGTLAVLALGVPGCGRSGTPLRTLDPAGSDAPLRSPEVLSSREGLLSVTLVAAAGAHVAGHDTRALGFNGGSPGPTLLVRPGDELAVRLVNRIGQATNLHTHGLRVSPQDRGDNPFRHVAAGEAFDYRISVPPDHPPGTGWYHPHHHGHAADQLFGGLLGALLVDGGPHLDVAEDRILLISETTLDGAGEVVAPSGMERMVGREGALVLVNGRHRPSLPATTGTLQRWRVVNACVSRILELGLEGHDLAQTAVDGSPLPGPVPRERIVLAPGNRAEVLVRPVRPGSFPVRAAAYARGGMPGMGGRTSARQPVVLATMTVTGAPAPAAPLPAAGPVQVVPPEPAVRERLIRFEMGMGPGGMRPSIDGRTFDPDRDDQQVRFGTVEEWTITNTGPFAHPFHLHVWPFTVLATSDGRQPAGVPQDVVLVPPGGWVRIRIPFTTHAGRSVYHCHVLDHEDAGMMATVVVHP